MQRFILEGRNTKDVEVYCTTQGTKIAKFTIAVPRRFSKNNETDFFDVKCFNNTAEYVKEYLEKGKRVIASGVVNVNHYDAKDGTKRTAIEVVADEVSVLEFGEKKAQPKPQPKPQIDDQQLPF